ncbi:hypothetical protein [Nocardia wallacei]|uniref:hypothetical protein n=1 Tax=Nocardia wallacei TaxID=480035 RepID=UPI0024576A1B|nr:hypothetical protein [Nocardia wallacei]
MSKWLTRVGVSAAAATVAAMASAGQAAADPASVAIDGSMQVMGMNVLHVDAQGRGDGPATGTYVANAQWGNTALPVKVTGPVTCLRAQGNTVSLVYPITSAQPVMVFAPDSMAIQITVAKGQNGAPNMIGYGIPMPTSSFRDCLPGPTPMVFDGTIDIS